MDSGGFDAVIGNPPYVRIQAMKEWAPLEVEHYKKAYIAASKGNYDIYVVFVEKGLGLLNGNGRLGFILPHKFFNAKYGEALRGLLSEGKHLAEIVHFGDQQVFAGATTYTCLLFLEKAGKKAFEVRKVTDLALWRATGEGTEGKVSATKAKASEWNFVVGKGAGLFEKLHGMPVKLGQVACRMYQGPITSADTVYLFKDFESRQDGLMAVFSKQLDQWVTIEPGILKRVIRSGCSGRFFAQTTALVLFPYEVKDRAARLFTKGEMESNYPLAWEYLGRNRRLLEHREKGKFKDSEWYRFGRNQNLAMWEEPKLLVPYMTTELAAYLDRTDHYYFINVTTGGYGITLAEGGMTLAYVCGLLNSRMLDFYFKQVSTNFHGGYFAANKQFIEQLPIRTIDFSDKNDIEKHDHMVSLVETMLDLHKRLQEVRTPHERTMIERSIAATDRDIDQLVYELYELTDEEIRIVEGGV